MLTKYENFHVEAAARRAVKEVVQTFTDSFNDFKSRVESIEYKIKVFNDDFQS